MTGLPAPVRSLAPGRLLCVAADRPALQQRLLARSLNDTLAEGVPAVLVAAAQAWPHELPLMRALQAHRRSGRLRTLDAAELVRRAQGGLQPVLDEIGSALPPAGGLVLIAQADALFGLSGVRGAEGAATVAAATAGWRAWCAQGGRVVLGLLDATDPAMRQAGLPHALACGFDGFAALRTTGDQARLDLSHWMSADEAARRTVWLVRADARRGLVARADPQAAIGPGATEAGAPVITHRAAGDFDAAGAGWRVVGGWSAAVQAARAMDAGVLVVHFHRPQDFRTLARTVAAIRSRAGPTSAPARAPAVIVRETGARLRLVQQVALLRLGASLIVARETDTRRLRLAAESFAAGGVARVEPDADRVLREVEATFREGACPPALFRREVERLLDGTGDELQHVLVRLDAAGGDVARLAAIGVRRVRDALICSQDDAVWLFLLGCAPERVEPVLARLFGARFERLFARRRLYDQPEAMRRALTALPPHDAVAPRDAVTSSPGAATSSAAR